MNLRKDIESALNSCCAENISNTPDFILAEYLIACLSAFDSATKSRDKWYSVVLEPANSHFISEGVLDNNLEEKQDDLTTGDNTTQAAPVGEITPDCEHEFMGACEKAVCKKCGFILDD